jgi:hypothetical protein
VVGYQICLAAPITKYMQREDVASWHTYKLLIRVLRSCHTGV